ncbi:hypothetical protein WJX82_000302 [Trebouxia sp. C0006]
MGLRQLCNQAADLSDGDEIVSHAGETTPAVETTPQQSSKQLLCHQPAAISAVGREQHDMPKWPATQQDEAHLKQLKRTGHWIKDQMARLMYNSRGHQFDAALRRFYVDILAMCARTESCVNHIHLTAILGGLAKAWATAEVCRAIQNHQRAVDDLHRFTARMLDALQPVCKALSAREASSLLSSLSRLRIDPGLLVPGSVDAIAQQLMANMWSANGRDLAHVVAAYSMLQLIPSCEDLMQAVSMQLAIADLSVVGFFLLAKITYSLATVPSAAPSIKTLDALLLESQGNKAQPIILTLSNPDYIRNSLGRLTGRAVFRAHMLAQQGRLVDYGRGCWQAGQQDMLYDSLLLIQWGFMQSVHISELLNAAK